ncbi:oligogalacturonate lyase family protein [Marinomonas sp.]
MLNAGPHDLVDTRMLMIDENGDNMYKVYEQSEEESCWILPQKFCAIT